MMSERQGHDKNNVLQIFRCEALNSWLKLDDCLWQDQPWFKLVVFFSSGSQCKFF